MKNTGIKRFIGFRLAFLLTIKKGIMKLSKLLCTTKGGIVMVFSSKTAFLLFVVYTLAALIWFFVNHSPVIGLIWLGVAVAELVIFLVCRKKEQAKKITGQENV